MHRFDPRSHRPQHVTCQRHALHLFETSCASTSWRHAEASLRQGSAVKKREIDGIVFRMFGDYPCWLPATIGSNKDGVILLHGCLVLKLWAKLIALVRKPTCRCKDPDLNQAESRSAMENGGPGPSSALEAQRVRFSKHSLLQRSGRECSPA